MESSFSQYDYILHKPRKKLLLIEEEVDDGGSFLSVAVDSFLSAVVEAYGMVGEMSSSDQQQVSSRLAAVKEKSVQCNRDMVGGSFDSEKWKCLARSVMDTLSQTVTEARQAQMLRQLALCQHNLDGILKCGFIEIILTEFKRLLLNTARLLEYVYKYLSFGTLKGQNTQNSLLLCAAQLQKLFPLLLRVLEATLKPSAHCSGALTSESQLLKTAILLLKQLPKELNYSTVEKDFHFWLLTKTCIEAKNFATHRMKVCLIKIRQIINGEITEEDSECDDQSGGLFITHMDQALSYLAVFDVTPGSTVLSENWRTSVEEVLQDAMLFAQIASQPDMNMIQACGEKVLKGCDSLEKEYKASGINSSLCKLHAASLSTALEELEQRVCASVLRMYLQIFSDPFAPLQTLCSLCWSEATCNVERTKEDLCDLINSFDSHTDRIIQVALFAIACSEDRKRVLGIRCCLASLESLEAHLVPALSTLYLQQAPSQRILASLLVEHWNSEVKLLRQLIDGIIDPAALAQVAHNVIWSPTAVIKKCVITNRVLEQDELKNLVNCIVSTAEVLSHQLQSSVEELHLNQHPVTLQALNDLLQAVREGKAVMRKIAGENGCLSIDRILKRCELLVSCVGHILSLLEELDDPTSKSQSVPDEEAKVPLKPKEMKGMNKSSPFKQECKIQLQKDFQRLVSLGLPADADIEIDTTDTAVTFDLMQSFMNKTPALPRFTTSFLYNKKTSKNQNSHAISTPRSGLRVLGVSRRAPNLEAQDVLHETFCLDVKKLASLSETLRCQGNMSLHAQSIQNQHSDIKEETNESDNIGTPERMQDLLIVQNKIKSVKESSHYYDTPSVSHQV